MRWSLGLAIAIVIGYSLVLVLLDEFVAKPWRHRRLLQRARAGDRSAQELLSRAGAAEGPNQESRGK
jgi:hypothetical protein